MPFIPVKSDITIVGTGGNANTANSAVSASTLYNSSSLFGILQISNSSDTSGGGYDISASLTLSKRAPTCIINATTISHSATNITYSATNMLHTASNTYEIRGKNINLWGGDLASGGGVRIYSGSTLLTNSVLYANTDGYVKGLVGTQTGQIPLYSTTPTAGWTLVNSSSITAGYAPTAGTIDGTLTVLQGGTGRTSLTAGAILVGNGTSAINFLTASVPSGSFVISDGTTWKVLSTSSLDITVSTASYLKSPYSNNLYIGFTSSSLDQTMEIYASDGLRGTVNITAKKNININSDEGDIILSCSDSSNEIQLKGNAGIQFNSPTFLVTSSTISITGSPEILNPLNYPYPVWNFSSSVANKTASILSSDANRLQIICNVGSFPIYISPTGAGSTPFSLGVNSSSQIYTIDSSRTLRVF